MTPTDARPASAGDPADSTAGPGRGFGHDLFADLLAANARYADTFTGGGFDGLAHAGVAMVTCMDSRIDPLQMIGLRPGDAKVLRNPGGRISKETLPAVVLAVHLLRVHRIMVVPHTRCAMVAPDDDAIRQRVAQASGQTAADLSFGAIPDQQAALRDDVRRLRAHPLIPSSVAIAGFLYDVDTGRLHRLTGE
ncbi:MAG TPA: carbonic anhydrase [Actinopolymorphaceae bacterium]